MKKHFTKAVILGLCLSMVGANAIPAMAAETKDLDSSVVVEEEAAEEVIYDEANIVDSAQTLEINEKNFPDPLFREALKEMYDSDGNGRLDPISMTDLRFYQNLMAQSEEERKFKGIKSLKGIELFPNLESIWMENLSVREIDFSKNTKLKEIHAELTPLETINFGDISTLEYVCLGDGGLKGYPNFKNLDLSKNPNLVWLELYSPDFEKLNISNCNKLSSIHIYSDVMDNVDLSGCNELTYLELGLKNLENVSVPNPAILKTFIVVGSDKFTSFDASGYTSIDDITITDCSNFKHLNLGGVKKLSYLWLYNLPSFEQDLDLTNIELQFFRLDDRKNGEFKLNDVRGFELYVHNTSNEIDLKDYFGEKATELKFLRCGDDEQDVSYDETTGILTYNLENSEAYKNKAYTYYPELDRNLQREGMMGYDMQFQYGDKEIDVWIDDGPLYDVTYSTHVQSYGWQGMVTAGAMSGTSGKAKRLESIKIDIPYIDGLGVQYTTHCQTYGWLPWSSNGEVNGTEGESKRLEAIKIQLTGENKDKYDIYYRVHAQSYGWLGWAKNGEAAGTAGYGKRLEGIQIVLVEKGDSAPGVTYKGIDGSATNKRYYAKDGKEPVVAVKDTPSVQYRTHVQSFGWQGYVTDGKMSGTSGKAKRLEGINIKLSNMGDVDGGITYRTHIQKYGWEKEWKSNGQMSGTSGEAKRLEAIQIKLTGEMAEKYDVYYRVHAQTYGWLGWAKNGEEAGTAGYAKRLEGIQVILVKKGELPPATYEGITSVRQEAYIKK